jgi:hypothetical protein
MPVSVKVAFAVLAWPAMWAGALMCVTLGNDIIRLAKKHQAPVARRAVIRG